MGLKFLPDSYRGQPELWLANQTGHMMLGIILVVVLSFLHVLAFGEYPYKSTILAVVLVGYGVIGELNQGWRGWDTVEDTLFVVGYGAGSILWTFREVDGASGAFHGNIYDIWPFIVAVPLHLCDRDWETSRE